MPIGQVRTARARFLLDYNGNPDVPMSWRFDRARAGSGALGDVGSHCIDLLQYLAGPIAARRRPACRRSSISDASLTACRSM